ncbi:MAG: GNAT family N-acetyltransferase [Chloroflexi bacterium]|nr:MAG: GNAT family N-acetyltransferase [Chloroflexota bacterium]
MQIDRDVLDARIARGCRCFVARSDDEVVAFGWLATRTEWIGELELEITPRDSEAYIWNCATHPAYRRQGFFRAVVNGIAIQARREGLTRLWIGTIDIPPAKAVADAGFAPALRFTTVWHAGIRWLRVRRAETPDPDLQLAAREVLAIRGRPLRIGTSMKRAVLRRH